MSGISFRASVLAADDLVDYLVSVYPELADPGDMDIDFESYGKSLKESWVEFPLMFDDLIDRARHVETQYLKTRYMIERGVEYCCVSRPNSHGDIVSSMCAVVTKDDGSSIILDPDRPIIYGLIRANPQRPLSDLIGVQSYLVRVFSEFVGRPGFTVRRLGKLVCVLRELIRLARLEQGDHAAHATGDTDKPTEPTNEGPQPLAKGDKRLHTKNSTVPVTAVENIIPALAEGGAK